LQFSLILQYLPTTVANSIQALHSADLFHELFLAGIFAHGAEVHAALSRRP
jgi:hypothetical protein